MKTRVLLVFTIMFLLSTAVEVLRFATYGFDLGGVGWLLGWNSLSLGAFLLDFIATALMGGCVLLTYYVRERLMWEN